MDDLERFTQLSAKRPDEAAYADAAARLRDDLERSGVAQLPHNDRAQELSPLFRWMSGWKTVGDEDCGVSLICPRCRERDIDAPYIPVPADGFGYLANLVLTALEHKCPEAGRE